MFSTAKIEMISDTSKYVGQTAKKADRQLIRRTNDQEKGQITNPKTNAVLVRRYAILALLYGSHQVSTDSRWNYPELM